MGKRPSRRGVQQSSRDGHSITRDSEIWVVAGQVLQRVSLNSSWSISLTSPTLSSAVFDTDGLNYCVSIYGVSFAFHKSDTSLVSRHTTAIDVCNLVYGHTDPVSWDTLGRFYEADAGRLSFMDLLQSVYLYATDSVSIISPFRSGL
jgi:hypothetical protein